MEENGKQSKIEHKPDEVMKKVGGGYLPYVECENCGHHITLKGWRDNICPNCNHTVKR